MKQKEWHPREHCSIELLFPLHSTHMVALHSTEDSIDFIKEEAEDFLHYVLSFL